MQRGTSYTVLLIEPDISLRRLIALGLQQRGLHVIEFGSLAAVEDQPIAHPDLLVLDIDNGWRADSSLLTRVQEHPYLATLPMVVLAWEEAQSFSRPDTLPLLEGLAKPFDARALHATIDNLLETTAAIETPAYEALALAPTTMLISTTSLSPMLTAAGLLLTVIGLMLQIVVAGIGLLIVLVGLLWWTLGKHPEHQVLLGSVQINQ